MSCSVHSDQSRSSVTCWFRQMVAGDADAVRQLWHRYAQSLELAARQKLDGCPRQVSDEEDVVVSVFDSLCRGAEEGRFPEIQGRDELWALLLTMTQRKAISHLRREMTLKRGGGTAVLHLTAGQSEGPGGILHDALVADEPDPARVAILNDQLQRLLGILPGDEFREITELRLDGYSVEEIARMQGIAPRSVERKLSIIRQTWRGMVELDASRG